MSISSNSKALKSGFSAKDRMYPAILCSLVLILSFILSPYSPLFRYVYDPDAVCYRIMSRGLLAGKVPYRDLFDHKGPLVYYIYSIGYFFCRNADWGAWIVIYLFNAIAYFFCYKTIRVFRNAEHAFLTTVLVIFVSGFSLYDIFATMSKPDNLLLAPLMVSVYLFVKETHLPKGETFKSIGRRSLFLIGLMCGVIFMIKLNVCLFYLAFVGFYFLWLLTRKRLKDFFIEVGIFLGGILAACVPVLLSLVCMNNLKEFFDIYIVFNIRYSSVTGNVLYLSNTVISNQVKNSLSIYLLLTLCALLYDMKKKLLNPTKIIQIFLAVIVMTLLTYSYVFGYFYIVFVPFYLYGTDWLSAFLFRLTKRQKNSCLIPVVFSILLAVMVGLQVFLSPFVPREKNDVEKKIEAYAQKNPQAQVLFLEGLCEPIYSNYLPTLPDFREFYIPPVNNAELYANQLATIKAKKAAVVVWTLSEDKVRDDSIRDYLENCGYHELQSYDDGEGYIFYSMYVLNET